MLKTTMDCHSELVLHLLGNNQPVQVVMHQRRQTALIFPGPCVVTEYTLKSVVVVQQFQNYVE